ncbi:MAG: ThuA domain-containing protein [Planctomycetales bacterium]|nr:ThuA domain-containing protein [Planctomycetales bacterium]
MIRYFLCATLFYATLLCATLFAPSLLTPVALGETHQPGSGRQIVLVAGETAKVDVVGHHDYLAGCKCLEVLLNQTAGVNSVRVSEGWPSDEAVLDEADAVVFYTDGGGKQAFLSSSQRVAKMQSLVDAGVGIVMIHQAVDFPDDFADQGRSWIGGVYEKGKSGRGHWPSNHVNFPIHPITRGTVPWQINDGWLNGIQFVDEMKGITPIVWSGKEYAGSRAGLDADIVCWAYERPGGGRSFSFTGLDAHSAWSLPGMRQLVVNGVLWSAGVEVPPQGASNKIEQDDLEQMQTPREPKKPKA